MICVFYLFFLDSAMFLSGKNLIDILDRIKIDLVKVCEWLKHNQLKAHAMFFPFSTHDQMNPLTKSTNILINIEFGPETKLLAETVDYKLKFDNHLNNILKKVNSKTLLLSQNSILVG